MNKTFWWIPRLLDICFRKCLLMKKNRIKIKTLKSNNTNNNEKNTTTNKQTAEKIYIVKENTLLPIVYLCARFKCL